MPGPGTGGTPKVAWAKDAKGTFGPWSPAVAAGVVYAGDQGGFVTALDEQTGAQRWQRDLGAAINSGVTVADRA